jgi:hypothetical protein
VSLRGVAALGVATLMLMALPKRAHAYDVPPGREIESQGVTLAVDTHYIALHAPPMLVTTHYPFASRMRSIPDTGGVDAFGLGGDLRWRSPTGWGVPLLGLAIAGSGATRTLAAPDGSSVVVHGVIAYDFQLTGVAYRASAFGWLVEASARPTLSILAATDLTVVGDRGRFDGSAWSHLRVGLRGELDVCTPTLPRPLVRFCAMAAPEAVAEGGGLVAAYGLRMEGTFAP